jgi:hypothetical protein
VNNMANVRAGMASISASPPHGRSMTKGSDLDTTSNDGHVSGDSGDSRTAAARASQPRPDIYRARQLALAARRLIEVVSESDESRMSRLDGDNAGALRSRGQDAVFECELARLVVAFNVGVLSEVSIS